MSYGRLTKENKLIIAQCPECNYFMVIDKDWRHLVGDTVGFHCDSCANDELIEMNIYSASLDNFRQKD